MPRTMMPGGVPSNSRAWNLRDAHASIRSRNRANCSSRRAAGVRGTCSSSSIAEALTAQGTSRPSVHHGKQQDHPVVVIASNVAACEGHQAFLPKRSDLTDQLSLFTTGGGFISAILRRQSASEECGPETKVPLTLVEYQPDSTPRRSDSSVMTCRGERFCIRYFRLTPFDRSGRLDELDGALQAELVQLSSAESRVRSASTAATRSR